MNFITKGDHLRIWNTASLWATKMSFFWVTATIFFMLMGNLCPWVVRLHTDHMYRVGYVFLFFLLKVMVILWYTKKGSSICSIVRHFKKEIQEIWKPSNKHPFNKLLQWKPFGVLWSPMTPTERTVGSRTAKAFRKCHVVARDAFIKRPYKFPFWGYERLEKLKKLLGAGGGDFCMGKTQIIT